MKHSFNVSYANIRFLMCQEGVIWHCIHFGLATKKRNLILITPFRAMSWSKYDFGGNKHFMKNVVAKLRNQKSNPPLIILVISRAGSFAVAFFHLVHWIKSCSFLSRSATRLFKRRRKKALTSDRVSYLVIPVQGKIFKALSVGRIERMSTDANEKGKLRASTQRALITIAVKAHTHTQRVRK